MLQILDNEIAKLRSIYNTSHIGNYPTRYTWTRGGPTHENWYYNVLETQDFATRTKMTEELLEDWSSKRRDRWSSMQGNRMIQMDAHTFQNTIINIQFYAPTLEAIRDSLFLDPLGRIFISSEMKESAIPVIIEGTLRIIGAMPDLATLRLDTDDMIIAD